MSSKPNFAPYENEADVIEVGRLMVENRVDRITVSGDVDLTAEGTQDWVHFGSLDANTFEHKAGVPAGSRISNVTPIGQSTDVFTDGPGALAANVSAGSSSVIAVAARGTDQQIYRQTVSAP